MEEKKNEPSPIEDIMDENFTKTPPIAVTTDDLVVAMKLKDYTAFLYTMCDHCYLRRYGCEFYIEHGRCQIERNLFREHLSDLQSEGANLRDKALVLASFIQLKEMWRSASKIAVFSEDDEMGTTSEYDDNNLTLKHRLDISKFLHKSVNDHTKQLLSILKELAATRKERIKRSDGDKKIESFSVLLSNLRKSDEKEEEETDN